MGKRGPKPTPTAILKARGSWRAGTRDAEPQPERGYPKCPTGLNKECKAEWKRLRVELEPMGVVTLADGSPLARIVWLRVQCRGLRKMLEGFVTAGYAYKCGDSLQQVPQVGILNKWHAELAKLEAEFGLTPASRTRIEVKPAATSGPKIATRTRNAG